MIKLNLLLILCLFVIFSFIEANLNPLNWPQDTRIEFVVSFLFVNTIIFAFKNADEELDD